VLVELAATGFSVLVELAATVSLKQQNIEAKKNALSDPRK
jgi:hypothetical protein